jgi:hypothetical protein
MTNSQPSSPPNIGQHDARIADVLSNIAESVCVWTRTPVLRRPSDVGMRYEETFFPSLDGLPLEAWLIPADWDRDFRNAAT